MLKKKRKMAKQEEEEEERPGAVQVERKTATGSPLQSSGSNRTRGEKQENRASSTLTFCDTHSVARSWNYITFDVHTWQRVCRYRITGRIVFAGLYLVCRADIR